MIIGIVFVVIVYTLLNVYLAWRYTPFIRAVIPRVKFWWVAVVFAALGCSYVLPSCLPMWGWVRIAGALGCYWMGFFAYSMLFFVILEIVRRVVLHRLSEKGRVKFSAVSAGVVLLLCVLLIIGGRIHALDIEKVSYDIKVEKNWDGPPLKVALLSDVHLGHINGEKRMEQIVEAVNEEQADIVCIAGDLFDSTYEGVRNPDRIAELLGMIESKYGVFLCWGNHDAGDEYVKMKNLIQKTGIHILEDEVFNLKGICNIVGRKDSAPIGSQGSERREWKEIQEEIQGNEPVLVLDHRPSNANDYENVDLVMSGHTHAGQIFPFNLLTRLNEKFNYGSYTTENGVPVIVTSGIGTWGPPLRIGTDSELALIQLHGK